MLWIRINTIIWMELTLKKTGILKMLLTCCLWHQYRARGRFFCRRPQTLSLHVGWSIKAPGCWERVIRMTTTKNWRRNMMRVLFLEENWEGSNVLWLQRKSSTNIKVKHRSQIKQIVGFKHKLKTLWPFMRMGNFILLFILWYQLGNYQVGFDQRCINIPSLITIWLLPISSSIGSLDWLVGVFEFLPIVLKTQHILLRN